MNKIFTKPVIIFIQCAVVLGGIAVVHSYSNQPVSPVSTQVATGKIVREIKSVFTHEPTNHKFTAKEVECLAKNIYFEAGVEFETGKIAVGHVTMNRLKTGRWGNNVCDVVYAKSQFSWTLFKDKVNEVPHGALWEDSKKAARKVIAGVRVRTLQTSLFYHTDYIKTPRWVDRKAYVAKIDQHIFYTKAKLAPEVKVESPVRNKQIKLAKMSKTKRSHTV